MRGLLDVILKNSLVQFALHTTRNLGIVLVIGVAALALHGVVGYMESHGMPTFATTLLTVAEYGVLLIDVGWFLIDLAIRAFKLLKMEWQAA